MTGVTNRANSSAVRLRARLKTRPVGAPGLQRWPISDIFGRPRAFPRRAAGVFKPALRETNRRRP